LEHESKAKLSQMMSDWIINELNNDFGFDYDVRITEINPEDPDKQIVTGWSFYIQLKSTDDDCENGFYHDLSVTDINLYLENGIPVLLVKYYSKCDLLFYEIIHSYVWDILDHENPKWREQGTKRIQLTKKIDDLERIKKEIYEVQIRSIRKFNYYNMGLGEGINPAEFDELRQKDLQEYKFKTIMTAFSEIKNGDEARGLELLQEACSAPTEDLLKFCSIINIILQLNPLLPENHEKIYDYSTKGLELSKEIDANEFEDFLKISICNLSLVQIITKIGQLLLTRNISKQSDSDFTVIYDIELINLYKLQEVFNRRIQTSIENLIQQNNIIGLAISSAILMETIIYQVQKFVLADEEYLKIEIEHRRPFIDNFEKLLSLIDDEDIIQHGYYKLAEYYFWICDYKKSEYYILKSINISNKLGYTNNVVSYNRMLDDIKNEKSPSDPKNRVHLNSENVTFAEIREATIQSLQLQGISLSGTDDDSENFFIDAICLGVEDIDPSEYLRYCEHLRVGYLYPSPLGQSIGLFSLGQKAIWCNKCGGVQGTSLKTIFNFFINNNCKDCDLKKSRDSDWICSWKAFEELCLEPEFQEYLKVSLSK